MLLEQGELVTWPSHLLGLQVPPELHRHFQRHERKETSTHNQPNSHISSGDSRSLCRRPLPTEGDAVKQYDRVVDMPTGWKVPPTPRTVVAIKNA